MNDKEKKQKQIKLLQQNLCSIRKIAGWTAEQLGEKIGLTKQTISNLENNKTPMTLTQYIAIRAVLDFEMQNHPNKEILEKVLYILVDNTEEIGADDYEKIKETVAAVSFSATSGIAGATLGAMLAGALSIGVGGFMLPAGAIIGASTAWLSKILKK